MRRAACLAVLAVGIAGCGRQGPAEPSAGTAGTTPASAAVGAAVPERKESAMPKVGDVAPDFRVRDHTGKERTLAEFRGKRVVLWFYPKADTPG